MQLKIYDFLIHGLQSGLFNKGKGKPEEAANSQKKSSKGIFLKILLIFLRKRTIFNSEKNSAVSE
jgi:hypothetical protein